MTRRAIVYGLAAAVALFAAGTIIGLIWAKESDVAGAIAVTTDIVAAVLVVSLSIALAVATRRR